jgi:hypothetical protein
MCRRRPRNRVGAAPRPPPRVFVPAEWGSTVQVQCTYRISGSCLLAAYGYAAPQNAGQLLRTSHHDYLRSQPRLFTFLSIVELVGIHVKIAINGHNPPIFIRTIDIILSLYLYQCHTPASS